MFRVGEAVWSCTHKAYGRVVRVLGGELLISVHGRVVNDELVEVATELVYDYVPTTMHHY